MIPLVTPKMMRTIKLEELSLSRAPHEWGAKCTGSNHHGTHHGLYHHTVHAGKHYKALIVSGAAISLLQYSTYQHIEDSFRTPKQPTTTKLNTANGSPMTAFRYNSFTIKDSRFQIYPQLCDLQQATRHGNYLWHRYSEKVCAFIHLGQGKELLYIKGW